MEAFFQLSRVLWNIIFCTYLVYYWDTVIKNILLVLRLYTHCDHFRRWSRVVNVTSLYTLALLFQNYLSGITRFICIMTLQGSFGFQYSLNFVKQHRMTVVIRVAGRSTTYVIMNIFCEEEILLCKQIRLQRNFENSKENRNMCIWTEKRLAIKMTGIRIDNDRALIFLSWKVIFWPTERETSNG